MESSLFLFDKLCIFLSDRRHIFNWQTTKLLSITIEALKQYVVYALVLELFKSATFVKWGGY